MRETIRAALGTPHSPGPRPGGSRTELANFAVLTATAGVALLTLVTLAGFLGGRWWLTDLLANLRVQYVVGFLLVSVPFAVFGPRALGAVCLGGALVNAVLVVPLYLGGPAPPAEGSDVLRIMFLNTRIDEADPVAVIDDLRTAQHDLVLFSAVTDSWVGSMESAPIPFTVAQARPRGTSLELLVLARNGLPVETTVHSFGDGGRSKAIEARVTLDGRPVRVLVMHPVSPITSRRAERQANQLSALAVWVRAQTDPVVVVGDLNATPWSPGFRTLLRDAGLVNSQEGFGIQASWPRVLGPLGIPIDHALHSKDLTTVDRALGPGYGSDHRSLHVAIALGDAP